MRRTYDVHMETFFTFLVSQTPDHQWFTRAAPALLSPYYLRVYALNSPYLYAPLLFALRERRSLSASCNCIAMDSTCQTAPAWLSIAFSMYINFLCLPPRVKPSSRHAKKHKERESKQALPITLRGKEERHEKEKCRNVTKSYKGKASD
jgi:hypothetical protein